MNNFEYDKFKSEKVTNSMDVKQYSLLDINEYEFMPTLEM